ncbi:MAG: GTP-binding protein [Anaerolineales bacterium]|nr:GTP-binding protein [Anaerolineales bacterium]
MSNQTNNPNQLPAIPEDFEHLLDEFPAEVRQLVEGVWTRLPHERQQQLVGVLPDLPAGNLDSMRRILDSSQQNLQMAFGAKQAVTIVGPANVGKSTLYNHFIAHKGDTAVVSPIPGTTKINQTADAGLFNIVDTPGVDAAGPTGQQERTFALEAARQADFLIIMFDAIQGIKETELALFRELRGLGKPFIVVLNKMDLVGGGWRKRGEPTAVLNQVANHLNLPPAQVIPISAKDGDNLESVVLAIVKAEPALLVALGRALPRYRSKLAWQAIMAAASTAGVIALTPIPIVDFVPLLALQGSLVLGIARIYNYKMTLGRAREMASTMGLGYLGRTLFQELSKLGGPPGWMLSAAIAASTTVVIGYTAVLWFSKGEKLSADASRQLLRLLATRLLGRWGKWAEDETPPDKDALAEDLANWREEAQTLSNE